MHLSRRRSALAGTRSDGAPAGTAYACHVCGYDTRWTPQGSKEGVGVYVSGIGVRHPTTADCMKIINHFLDQKFDLGRPHHREDAEA